MNLTQENAYLFVLAAHLMLLVIIFGGLALGKWLSRSRLADLDWMSNVQSRCLLCESANADAKRCPDCGFDANHLTTPNQKKELHQLQDLRNVQYLVRLAERGLRERDEKKKPSPFLYAGDETEILRLSYDGPMPRSKKEIKRTLMEAIDNLHDLLPLFPELLPALEEAYGAAGTPGAEDACADALAKLDAAAEKLVESLSVPG